MFDKVMARHPRLEATSKSVVSYVHHRRGRFSAIGTVVVLYPWLRRPHHTWLEFEKDFRMYDKLSEK